jgi:GNAT superfamily N-acetyltransferase
VHVTPEHPQTYWKVAFEWPGDRVPSVEPSPPRVAWSPAADVPQLTCLVGRILAHSVGAWDIAAVSKLGAEGAAAKILAPTRGFSFQPEWWEVITLDRIDAGFVLPVIYDDCARDGLDEATIYHLGVAPEQRGRGLGRMLLRRATQTLLDHGVWRIFCDTGINNAPMIHLFQHEGWTRLPAHRQPIIV